MFIVPLFIEVMVPVNMKEVGGYIEKQAAYLSGETWLNDFSINHTFAALGFFVFFKMYMLALLSLLQGAVGKTPVSSSLSQNALLSVTFQRKLYPKYLHT